MLIIMFPINIMYNIQVLIALPVLLGGALESYEIYILLLSRLPYLEKGY